MDFQFTPSTGQDDEERRRVVEEAAKARRWSIIPQLIAGAGDVINAGNKAYGVNNSTDAASRVQQGVEGRIADTSKQFEVGLTNNAASDASKQYQNLLGKFLGKDPKTFANMSAAQIKEQIPAIEKLSQMENTRAMKDLTIKQQGESRKASVEDRKLTRENLELNRSKLDEDRDLKRQLQEDQQLESKVQKHSTELQKNNLPELVSTYNELQGVFESGEDVAGIGLLDSQVPGMMLSSEGVRNRTNLQQLANSLLKSRSGAAVSDQEYRRFLLELQAGKVPTEKAVKAHLGKMGMDAKTIIGQLEAGLPPAALEQYKSHPGAVTSGDVKDPSVLYNKPGAEVKRKTKDGKIAVFDSATKKFVRYE